MTTPTPAASGEHARRAALVSAVRCNWGHEDSIAHANAEIIQPDIQRAIDAVGATKDAEIERMKEDLAHALRVIERWQSCAARACRGAVVTPDVDPVPGALIELRELADSLETKRDTLTAARELDVEAMRAVLDERERNHEEALRTGESPMLCNLSGLRVRIEAAQ